MDHLLAFKPFYALAVATALVCAPYARHNRFTQALTATLGVFLIASAFWALMDLLPPIVSVFMLVAGGAAIRPHLTVPPVRSSQPRRSGRSRLLRRALPAPRPAPSLAPVPSPSPSPPGGLA